MQIYAITYITGFTYCL